MFPKKLVGYLVCVLCILMMALLVVTPAVAYGQSGGEADSQSWDNGDGFVKWFDGKPGKGPKKIPAPFWNWDDEDDDDEDDDKKNKGKQYFKTILNTRIKDGKLNMEFSLVNKSGRWIPIAFKPDRAYKIIVTDENGSEIYSKHGGWVEEWDELKIWEKEIPLFFFFLKPGQMKQLSFSDEWNFKDNNGKSVSNGKYKITVEIEPVFVLGFKNEEYTEGFTAQKIIEVKNNQLITDSIFETELKSRLNKDGLDIDFSFKNVSSEVKTVKFPSGQLYDIKVFDASHREVYRWSEGKVFTQAVVIRTLYPGNEMKFSETWDLTGKDGRKVRPGVYKVEVTILAKPTENDKAFSAGQLTARQTIRIESQQVQKDIFSTSLNTWLRDDEAILYFSLKNVSNDDIRVRYNTSQKYDFVVTDGYGREVYRWSDGKDFLTAIQYQIIEEGKSVHFYETWDLRDKNGKRVPAGRYRIKVEIKARPEKWGETFDPEELTDQKYIYIEKR